MIKRDRYRPTLCVEEHRQLIIQADKTYAEGSDPEWNRNGTNLDPQVSIAEESQVEDSVLQGSVEKHRVRNGFTPPTVEEVRAYCREKNYTFDAERFVEYYTDKGWMVGMKPMTDWKKSAERWERSERPSGGVFTSRMQKGGYV
jgi:hypothetical protein